MAARLEVEDGVAVVTLDNAPVNALTPAGARSALPPLPAAARRRRRRWGCLPPAPACTTRPLLLAPTLPQCWTACLSSCARRSATRM